MNKNTKEQFIKFTSFLKEVLGLEYEIVFHVIEKNGSYIEAIENSHISGRSKSSPLSAQALKMIQDKVYLDRDFLCGYKASIEQNSFKEKKVAGSTFFIKEDDELVGILCINHDNSKLKDAVLKIIELQKLGSLIDLDEEKDKENQEKNEAFVSVEKLSLFKEEIIEEIIEEKIDIKQLQAGFALAPTQLDELISLLHQRGVFNIKGSIKTVASLLNISEPSVYRYLKKLE